MRKWFQFLFPIAGVLLFLALKMASPSQALWNLNVQSWSWKWETWKCYLVENPGVKTYDAKGHRFWSLMFNKVAWLWSPGTGDSRMQIGVGYECIPFLRGNLGLIGALGSPTTLSTQGLSERGPSHHPESQLWLLANGCCTRERMIEPQPTCFPNSACLGPRQHIFLRVLECTAWAGCVFLRSYKGLQDFSAFRVPTFQHSWVLFHIFKVPEVPLVCTFTFQGFKVPESHVQKSCKVGRFSGWAPGSFCLGSFLWEG